jgi:Flp pilus assembly protein TadB
VRVCGVSVCRRFAFVALSGGWWLFPLVCCVSVVFVLFLAVFLFVLFSFVGVFFVLFVFGFVCRRRRRRRRRQIRCSRAFSG